MTVAEKLPSRDVSDMPEVLRLVDAVAAAGEAVVLQVGHRDVAVLSPTVGPEELSTATAHSLRTHV